MMRGAQDGADVGRGCAGVRVWTSMVRRRLPTGASPSRSPPGTRSDAQSNAVGTEGGLRRSPGTWSPLRFVGGRLLFVRTLCE